jgi:hypothetical protein
LEVEDNPSPKGPPPCFTEDEGQEAMASPAGQDTGD